MTMMDGRDFFEELEKQTGQEIPNAQKEAIKERLRNILKYEPTVGIFGKTGVGKSTLCNALFGNDVFPVDDIEACTRNPQEAIMKIGGSGIKLLDLPGVAENQERDDEYRRLYESFLPKIDLALWVLNGSTRDYGPDERFYKELIKPQIENLKSPLVFFFVLNWIDQIKPSEEWDKVNHRPSDKQKENIKRKIEATAKTFQIDATKVIAVSAEEKYGLPALVQAFIFALPKEQRVIMNEKIQIPPTPETKKKVEESWGEILEELVVEYTGSKALGKVAKKVGNLVESAVDWVKSWF